MNSDQCGRADPVAGGEVRAGEADRVNRKSVLILCTGNSCRSQMAEAFWRLYGGAAWEVASAGTRPGERVDPLAVRAMAEKGIDLSGARPKSAEAFAGHRFDLIITVCDSAAQECPGFGSAERRLHWPFDDPPKAPGGVEEKMHVYRRVRDEIEAAVRAYLTGLETGQPEDSS